MDRDVVIVGGGPAGLAAALVLGRSCKRVTLFDDASPRNAPSGHVHGLLAHDGIAIAELRAIGRAQLARYPAVEIRDARVTAIERSGGGFLVHAERPVTARAILLATGLVDELPPLPGLAPLWGTSVVQCPYCHAWELRERRYGFLPRTSAELEFALLLRGWTDDVIVFSDGISVDAATRRDYARANVRIEERRVTAVHGDGDRLRAIQLADGTAVERDVLFITPVQRQVPLVQQLALRMHDENSVHVDERGETSTPGIYAAGDLTTPIHGAALAAAAGTAAAYKLNTLLTKQLVLGPGSDTNRTSYSDK